MEPNFHSIFAVNDLLTDDETVADALLQSCRRHTPRQPIALCQLGAQFVVTLKPANHPPADLRFVHLTNFDADTMVATLHERWMGGYDPVGLVTDQDENGNLHGFLLVLKEFDD